MRVLVLGNFYVAYNRRILHGVGAFARLHGWTLAHQFVGGSFDPKWLHQADALLLGVHDFELRPAITKSRLPRVGWSANHERTPWPRVLTDNQAVGRTAAEYFIAAGYRNFAFYPDIPGFWSIQRRDGFLDALNADRYFVSVLPRAERRPVIRLAERLCALPRPLALLMPYDMAIDHVVAACARASLRIPEDVAVVGTGDDEMICEINQPPLSSITQLTERIGYEAAAILHRMLNENYEPPEFTLIPPGELVVRRSSDAMAFDDPIVAKAMHFIRDQQPHGVSTKQVVAHIGTSRVTLDVRFVAATGTTVAETIRRLRIEKSKNLLSSSDLPMSTIANYAGFSSARQFSKTFRQFQHQSPTEFRQKIKVRPAPHDPWFKAQ